MKIASTDFLILAHQSVRWLAPFTKEILDMRGIVDLITDLTYLKTLYPDIPKTCIEKLRCKKENRRQLSRNPSGQRKA